MPLKAEDRKALIRAIQSGVPLEQRPFASIAQGLGSSELAVIEELRALEREKVLREISAVLEGGLLGYRSALATGSIPEERIETVARIVSAHPTVSHNYLRDHPYNLWFTIAVPPEMPLERTLELLAKEAGVDGFYALCRTHIFKIGVNFDPDTLKNRTEVTKPSSVAKLEVVPREAELFRALQTPLPLIERPFDELAQNVGASAEELIEFAKRHLGGAIRRYVGTLRHRKLGVKENGMVVWRVADDEVQAAGEQLAKAPEVSHCYARNPVPYFPYTLYSMVHGPSRESCREIARQLSRQTGLEDYAVLFSEREFKKQRLRYFLPELDRWWTAHA
jgi:DNA-binding Lrp family transcriptional regulator